MFVGISWYVSRGPLRSRFEASWGGDFQPFGAFGGLLGTSGGLLGSVAAGKPLVGLLGASWGPLGGLSKTIQKLGFLRSEASFHCKIQ